ncbi:MAG: hypothetical protein QM689_03055 [Oscillospiraceae bacterium]
MKIRSIFFMLSFISYFFLLIASPHITACTWADLCLYGFFAAVIYQLLYIVILRKKDHVSQGRSIARTFLFAFFAASCHIAMYYIDRYVNGYSEYTFLMHEKITTYYGLEAWKHDTFANYIDTPLFIFFTIYEITYFSISKKRKRKAADLSISQQYEQSDHK